MLPMIKTPPTHMFPAGYPLHPNEQDETSSLRQHASPLETDRSLSDRLRYPYLAPEHHHSPERDRLPFRLERG